MCIRDRPITARKLGDDFDRAAVLALWEQNAHRAAEQTATVPEYPRNIRERLQGKKAVQTTPEKDGIQPVSYTHLCDQSAGGLRQRQPRCQCSCTVRKQATENKR